MQNKAFVVIETEIKNVLLKNGFEEEKIGPMSSVFVNKDNAYKLNYHEERKCFELFAGVVDENEIGEYKLISTWLFDAEKDTEKEAKIIAKDFVQTLEGSRKKKIKQSSKKKADEEKNVDMLFLMNRLAGIFPELKNDIQYEKQDYVSFRGVTFAKEKALPYVQAVLNQGAPKDKFDKICSIFNNVYNTGDFNTRSVITMVFLNSIENKQSIERAEAKLNQELKDVWGPARKLKGKKIKPEKRKQKKNSIFAETLAEQAAKK